MAHFEFRLPDVGEGVAEGEIVAWHVVPGQVVREDDEMVEVMTDKATVSIGAPKSGRVVELLASEGDVVKVGSVIVTIDTEHKGRQAGGDRAVGPYQAPASMKPVARERARRSLEKRQRVSSMPAPAAAEDALARTESAASAVGDIRDELPGMQWLRRQSQGSGARSRSRDDVAMRSGADGDGYFETKPLATPATRKLARDLDVDLRRVRPTGAGGRVTKDDVRGHVESFDDHTAARARPDAEPAARRVPKERREERQPFVGLRRRIAQRMHDATTKPAVYTFVEEVEVDRLAALVERLRPAAESQGVRLHYLPFIVKAVTLALAKHPLLNSMLDEETNELVLRRYYDIGIATATEHGLVVPVVRDADEKTPLQLAAEIQRLADGARKGGLHAEELKGSTFTVTSLGKRGGLLATPVLNYPEVGILGVHRIRQKPVVREGQIAIGQVMMLSLSLDHRVVDGDAGAAFAYDVIAYLENPDLLLLEMH